MNVKEIIKRIRFEYIVLTIGWILFIVLLNNISLHFQVKLVIISMAVAMIVICLSLALIAVLMKFKEGEFFHRISSKRENLSEGIPWFLITLAVCGYCYSLLFYVGTSYFDIFLSGVCFAILYSLKYPVVYVILRTMIYIVMLICFLSRDAVFSMIVVQLLVDLILVVFLPRLMRNPIPFKIFYDSGEVKEVGAYVNSRREGLVTRYYKNGNKEYEIFSVKDKPHGFATWFDENGKVLKKGNYNVGLLEGEFKYFDKSGSIYQTVNYFHGKMDGILKTYFETGNIKSTHTYKKDILNGKYQFFSEDGNLTKQGYYLNGVLHGQCQWFDEEGKLTAEANYQEGKEQ